jgi:hypothetical protein
MNYNQLLECSNRGEWPDELHPLLQALLLEANGAWDAAHRIAQGDPTRDGSWVHAYLHRVEGDLGNSNYWYRSAGRTMPDIPFKEEWETIASELIKKFG